VGGWPAEAMSSNLEKLRRKKSQRSGSLDELEALLQDGASATSKPAALLAVHAGPAADANNDVASHGPGNGVQGSPPRSSTNGNEVAASPFDAPPQASASSTKRSASDAGPPPFLADGPCPATPRELRVCVAHFICGSPAFGPLPVSGVGLNAALRREYMRAGHARNSLSIFRSQDTIEAIRRVHQELQAAQCPDALVLDDASTEDDLLIVDVDRKRICQHVLEPELSRGADSFSGAGTWVKRVRHTGQPNGAGDGLLDARSNLQSLRGGVDGAFDRADHRHNGAGATGVESVEDLLKAPTAKQRQLIDAGDELRKLLAEPTARQSLTAQKFMNKSQNMAQFCPHGSRADCRRATDSAAACAKIHFKKIIKPWTDEALGDCSYLDTCRHIDKCKYVHYALDLTVEQAKYLNECGVHNRGTDTKRINELAMKGMELPSQWIQCDMRVFPLSIFNGMITVVMADPPWDIHMELPYGTLTDDEVRNLKIGEIHEDGMIFLWVTGRAMELARDCFRIWGYKRIEEIVWVKTNQLQRIIRTGRTGHWINHSKEHCLVGIKGNPRLNKNLDCDVIVSEVRETSRKPDEIYNLIERMFPNCMKLELFGRPHNVHENWITCGNQLDGIRLCDEEIVRRYNHEFPNEKIEPWRKEKDALVPAAPCGGGLGSRSGGSGGLSSGIAADGGPWIPPLSAPAVLNGPAPPMLPHPSSQDAWVPPSWPPMRPQPPMVPHERDRPQRAATQPASGGEGQAASRSQPWLAPADSSWTLPPQSAATMPGAAAPPPHWAPGQPGCGYWGWRP